MGSKRATSSSEHTGWCGSTLETSTSTFFSSSWVTNLMFTHLWWTSIRNADRKYMFVSAHWTAVYDFGHKQDLYYWNTQIIITHSHPEWLECTNGGWLLKRSAYDSGCYACFKCWLGFHKTSACLTGCPSWNACLWLFITSQKVSVNVFTWAVSCMTARCGEVLIGFTCKYETSVVPILHGYVIMTY